ncbi:cellulase family glycosylhydrolase [Hymenobacter sp. HDW8]|uniref:cellulase family glycosylhydrolase n=1 Tax=Hymenobacter sp. HDW8 TaxID=2714932 RepID=UPI00140C8896|nr:cellulase family glycosylhydrolase [Hymenobacter sp. HDW8]QIL75275.1 cellulase family glycosylhydrolase [Hymenobacter sp. HDW8]
MKLLSCLFLLTFTASVYAQTEPVKVEVKQANGRYELLRGGKPYFINGAGGGQFPERIKAYGGNSIRTWSTNNADKVLAEANKNGLTVMLGLDVARERHGFDYNNPQAVAEQLQKLRAEVVKYKDNPAVLFWGIGNELNLEYTNPKVWDAVQQIAQMIHEVDPNHPTSTVLAGHNQKEVDYIKAKCPAVDILSINTYAGLAAIPQQVRTTGWTGPYVVAEWGPTGHWESPVTPWKASVEETSSQKAAVYQSRYEASVAKDKTQCLGTYVFLWGQKQERTPTWYGIFTEDGKESEVVDVMQYLWSGKWPQNRAPHLGGFLLDGKKSTDNIYLQAGQSYPVVATVTDPNKDPLTYRYELLPESTDLKSGGDRESRPVAIPGLIPTDAKAQTKLTAPTKEGAYRLFVYADDGHDNVATANIPFYVKGK